MSLRVSRSAKPRARNADRAVGVAATSSGWDDHGYFDYRLPVKENPASPPFRPKRAVTSALELVSDADTLLAPRAQIRARTPYSERTRERRDSASRAKRQPRLRTDAQRGSLLITGRWETVEGTGDAKGFSAMLHRARARMRGARQSHCSRSPPLRAPSTRVCSAPRPTVPCGARRPPRAGFDATGSSCSTTPSSAGRARFRDAF